VCVVELPLHAGREDDEVDLSVSQVEASACTQSRGI